MANTKTSARPTAAQRSSAAREVRARKAMRIVALIGGVPIIGVALYNSYFHIVQLCIQHGQSQSAGHLTPFAIDGLLVVASIAGAANRRAPLPWIAFSIGALMTLGANVASVGSSDPIGIVMAAAPALGSIVGAPMIEGLFMSHVTRRHRQSAASKAVPAVAKAPQTAAKETSAPAPTQVAKKTRVVPAAKPGPAKPRLTVNDKRELIFA